VKHLVSIAAILVVSSATWGAEPRYTGDDAAQDIWLIENGSAETWAPAMRRLMAERHLNRKAVASVLRRMDALQGRDRIALCRALGTASHDPRALDALLKLTRDPEADVQRAARQSLLEQARRLSPDWLLQLAAQEGDKRKEFLRSWQGRYSDVKFLQRSPRAAAIIADAQQLNDEPAFSILRGLAAESNDLADAATEALGLLVDMRVADELFRLAMAGRQTASFQLARRGDARAFDPLVEWGRASAARAGNDFDRKRALESVGHTFPAIFFPRLIAIYRATADPSRKQEARWMIEGQLGLKLLDEPAALEEIRRLANDPDEFLRSTAVKVLGWERNRDAERSAPERVRRAWLVSGSLAGIILGVMIYLLAFRLLMLKRFVQHLPVQKIRSAPAGLVALQGKVEPHQDQHTMHPLTGEKCVVFERTRYPFWLDDDTGRILVDPQGAALLSEDRMLVPGEKVLVVGTLQKGIPAGETSAQPYLARRDHELTWFTRISGWVVRAATGLFLGLNAARMMFLNERQCFWIWDDLDERPFLAEHETSGMTAGLLFAGAWILVFVGAVLGLSSM
jgi:HEAT repeat protein